MFGKALLAGLDIVERLTAGPAEGLGYSALRAATAVSPASFGRFLRILLERGYVSQAGDGRYRLGWRVAAQGAAALGRHALRAAAQGQLNELVRATEESAEAAVFEDGHFLFVHRAESPRSVVLRAQAGSRFPIRDGTALGLLGLAFGLAEAGPGVARAELERIRRAGFAACVQNNGEVYRAAAAVLDRAGACVGCLTVAAPAFRVRRQQMALFRRLLLKAARAVSGELGRAEAPRTAPGRG